MLSLKRIVIAVAVLLALVIGIGFLLPATAHVERSIVINVPETQVFTMLNGFERFNEWSPWAKLDPETTYEFSGPSTGVGAKMSWDSHDPGVGVGSQEIIESTPPNLVRVLLKFEGQNDAISFHRLEPMETGTKVSWGFDAEFGNDVVSRWFGYLMFDSMIGGDFEKGLQSLKAVLEQSPAPQAPAVPTETPSSEPPTEPSSAPAQATG